MEIRILRITSKFGIAILIIAMISLFSCNVSKKTSTESMEETGYNTKGIKQKKKSLIIGESQAICYSGFRTGQHPDRGDGAVNPSAEEVLEDLQIIRNQLGIRLIRMYDVGDNTQMVLETIRKHNMDIKVMLGIWLKAELSAHETCAWLNEPIPDDVLQSNKLLNIEEIDKGIQLAREYNDIIVAVSVGNEALVEWNDHKVDTDTIISYVKRVKNSIDQKVTVADNYDWWANHGEELAKAVDYVSIHIYPVWEGRGIEDAMPYSIENIRKVMDALPKSQIVITEAGWATTASEFGHRASEANQTRYYKELMSFADEMNITTFWFEAFDEDWKGNPDNPIGAEKHWGVYKVDRSPKEVVKYIIDNK